MPRYNKVPFVLGQFSVENLLKRFQDRTGGFQGIIVKQKHGYRKSRYDLCRLFNNAPSYTPRAKLITGKIRGIRVETNEDPLMKKIRQLDKLVDELAKGKPMDKILR